MTTSYITRTEADTYFAAVGEPSAWAAANSSQQDAALINASEWLDRTYGKRWVGTRIDRAQVRDWPGRENAVDADGFDIDELTTPVEVSNSTAEAADRFLVDETLTDGDVTERGITREAVVADTVEEDISYSGVKPNRQKAFPKIDAMLCRILRVGTGEAIGVVSLG